MAVQTVPTKGNLMNTKKSLALAKNGYELLDRKRNILIREMMTLIDHANAIQQKIDDAYAEAYTALQTANVTNGFCEDISNAIPYENGLKLDSRSVMGVEIPILTIEERDDHNTYTTVCAQQIRQLIRFIRNLPKLKILQLSLPRLRTVFTALPIQSRKLRREQTLSRTL